MVDARNSQNYEQHEVKILHLDDITEKIILILDETKLDNIHYIMEHLVKVYAITFKT